MSELPVSADTYFDDFEMEITPCIVVRLGKEIGKYNCIPNEEDGNYIHVRLKDNPDIAAGDLISFDDDTYTVTKVKYDTYNGEKQLMKIYY